MQTDVTILDLGIGNARSVHNMLTRIGVRTAFADSEEQIYSASRLILPGVGSFDRGVAALDSFSGVRAAMTEMVCERRIPFMGICLGMQMIYEASDEGEKLGLGWLSGRSRKIATQVKLPIPQMGWNTVRIERHNSLAAQDREYKFYFAHSYCVEPKNASEVVGTAEYGGTITAIVNRDNIFGVQFHPEKSHRFGLDLLRTFSGL